MPRVAVVFFPGTNCERETLLALRDVARVDACIVRPGEFKPGDWDAVVLPGGFSYSDYVRAGVMATWGFADKLVEAVNYGTPVLGICNGFQILVEAGILPGALLANECGCFIARWVRVKIVEPRGPWLGGYEEGEVVWMPVAHHQGRWWGEKEPRGPRVLYIDNPNGSRWDIAGATVKDGLVLGLMPHPERAVYPWQSRGRQAGGYKMFKWIGVALRAGW